MYDVDDLYEAMAESKTLENTIRRMAASILTDAIAKKDNVKIKQLIGAVHGTNISLADVLINIKDKLEDNYQGGLFYLDEPKFAFSGWSFPNNTWNGAQKPVFTIDTAIELMHLINDQWGEFYKVSRQNDKKCFTVVDLNNDETTVIYDLTIVIQDNPICVSPFMSGCWTWYGAFTEQEKQAVRERNK